MNRREFTKLAAASTIAIGLDRGALSAVTTPPQFAITMDDFNWRNAIQLTAEERNRAILDTLAANRVKAALFVMGRNADDQEGMTLLRKWDGAGHLIGNHTYSHRSLNSNVTAAEYENDILRAETILIGLNRFRKIFRFPMLKEGNTAAKRDHVRAFLKSHGYRTGHVTIDNSDWIIDSRLSGRLAKDPKADVIPYRDFYLELIWY